VALKVQPFFNGAVSLHLQLNQQQDKSSHHTGDNKNKPLPHPHLPTSTNKAVHLSVIPPLILSPRSTLVKTLKPV